MKNALRFLMVGVMLSGLSYGAYAVAQVCQKSDIMCYESGPSQNLSTPFRIDASGNVTSAGNETITGTGSNTYSGAMVFVGKTIYTPTVVTAISSVTIISPSATYLTVVSSGANVTCGLGFGNGLAAAPCISTTTATNGQYLVIGGTSSVSTVTFTDGATAGMQLGAATRLIDNLKKLTLIFDSFDSQWKEVSFGNN